jgi:protocatechuate 3,4-dioxygenase, alpha subunit
MGIPTTPSQTVGPYYAIGLQRRPDNELDPEGVVLSGRLLDGEGDPIDGMVEVWDPELRAWGRSGTDADGRFEFRVGPDRGVLEAYVFARGLLKHQRTRVYLREDAADDVLDALPADQRRTLVAKIDNGALHWDIRMQGDRATVFFAV